MSNRSPYTVVSDYSRHDEALAWLAPHGPNLAWGFTNHHYMVVEALSALGRPEAIRPWLEAHREGLTPAPEPATPIGDDWRAALGSYTRFPDWERFFREALERAPWRDVLADWSVRLAPGLSAAATHGLIRTAHAARALLDAETPPRKDELAAGLAYWADTWQTLPCSDAPAPEEPSVPAAEALASVPMILETRPPSPSIVAALHALDDDEAFAQVIHRLDVSRDAQEVVGDLTATFAAVLLANVTNRLEAIVFTHGVTSAATLRTLLPLLPEPTHTTALRYAWQAGAGLYATFAHTPPRPPTASDPPPEPKALVDAAIASGDDHAIKLTEACLAEHARSGLPVYLAAAWRGIQHLRED